MCVTSKQTSCVVGYNRAQPPGGGHENVFFARLENRWGRFAYRKLSRDEMGLTMKAPPHLGPETRKWFTSVVTTYHLEPHHLRLLQLAGEAWDRCQQAREAIAKEGLTVASGGRAHPAIAIERDSRLAFARPDPRA